MKACDHCGGKAGRGTAIKRIEVQIGHEGNATPQRMGALDLCPGCLIRVQLQIDSVICSPRFPSKTRCPDCGTRDRLTLDQFNDEWTPQTVVAAPVFDWSTAVGGQWYIDWIQC